MSGLYSKVDKTVSLSFPSDSKLLIKKNVYSNDFTITFVQQPMRFKVIFYKISILI